MYRIKSFFDAPRILDTSSTNIPGSGSNPLQVIASLPYAVNAVYTIDTTGKFIELYQGSSGSETLVCILGGDIPAISYFQNPLKAGTRISLRSADATAISTGVICCQFLDGAQFSRGSN